MFTTQDIKSKFWALEIISSGNQDDLGNISGSLQTSKIDLNPHQIEAALFALNSPVSQGVILADEVGLGKTIEAGIVISEYYSRGKTSILVVAPASLCQQWQTEMRDKFSLPTKIIDTRMFNLDKKLCEENSFSFKGVTLCSYNCAAKHKNFMKQIDWDLVVLDEAHKLRNLYKGKTKIADGIFEAFKRRKKLLLTATPIQNSLLDIFSLVTLIDPNILSSEYAFAENYLNSDTRLVDLKDRLKHVLHRTLRQDVSEYIKYTNREAVTVSFNPTPAEIELYGGVSEYIQKISRIAITTRFRALIVLMIRKLMSSSTAAVKGTLEGLMNRLNAYNEKFDEAGDLKQIINDTDLWEEYYEEFENIPLNSPLSIYPLKTDLAAEKTFLQSLIDKASQIKVDGKTQKLVDALIQGFEKIEEKGGNRKAIIFTESNRTLNYLYDYLSENGFENKIVTFNGQNNSPLCHQIYNDFVKQHPSELTGSRANDMKKALVNAFKEKAQIMIATEAAAEGLNLQFCSLLVNYDLPWNPQRVEQRIGRIHRYGQKCEVVIINFLNKKNLADIRLYDILRHKFKLFDGVFGASDGILGTLADGLDFERAVCSIFDLCRTTDEINRAFDELQESVSEKINAKMEETKQLVLENLNPTTQEKFRLMKKRVDTYLERRKQIFWDLSVCMLAKNHPDMHINETKKLFGPFKEQVFDLPSDIKFAKNFNFYLDFSKRKPQTQWMSPQELKAEKWAATPYNPDCEFGKRILTEALSISSEKVHLRLKESNRLKTSQKGRLLMSVYKMLSPESKCHLITTILDENGGISNLSPADIFDNALDVQEPILMGYQELATQIHAQEIQKYQKKEKARIDALLKSEIEKLNRWLADEKQTIQLKGEKTKNKITNLKRQFKMEKDFAKKLALDKEIQKMQSEFNETDFNTFDIEREFEKKCNRLIGGKKRSLKLNYTVELVFDVTWSVE